MEYGLQLYSVRDLTEQSLEEAIAKVAALGYKKMEFAGFFGHTAEEVNAMLKKYDVELSGTHSAFDDLVNNYEETVAYHKAIGNKHYIIPGYNLKTQERLDTFIAQVNEILPKLAAEGIALSFHNHHREFLPNEDGAQIFDQLYYRTDLKFEVDTYWAFVGMKQPINLLNRVKDRLLFVHVKDGSADGKGTPLGMGEAPVADVWAWAKENNVPMVVESETCKPDGITEAKICIEYLHSLEK
ncbi:MAG: sugar phosphate isomerase/epimerase [Clostridia bacterium]|nr:sugar phosphate isomerase/epimerase [Clostridia bacterium]